MFVFIARFTFLQVHKMCFKEKIKSKRKKLFEMEIIVRWL